MKKLYLLLILTFHFLSASYAQLLCNGSAPDEFTFDNGMMPVNYWLVIDSSSHHKNIWQIGPPHKTFIISAYSAPNVIITDTVHPYPPNDTSVFTIKHVVGHYLSVFAGYYNVSTDSLKDYATMEISPDNGTTWINLLTDVVYSSYIGWSGPKPTLTGNSNGWNYFEASVASIEVAFNVHPGDTILFRITIISDSITDNLDGIAFDNFMFCDYIEGLAEIPIDRLVIYPNPTNDLLYISRRITVLEEAVQIYNELGQLQFEDDNFKSRTIDIKRLNLVDGFYYIKYTDNKNYFLKKFVVRNY